MHFQMPIWIKKEQELLEVGIPDPLDGRMMHTKNWIWGCSHTDGSRELVTSSSEVTSMIEKVKTLIAKEKTGKFKSEWERDQLSTGLENEEHRGRTRAIFNCVHARKGLQMKVICTRSVEHMSLHIMMKRHLLNSSLIS
jgi:hypothetical protein